MDLPTYPFEETSFMNGPLCNYKIKQSHQKCSACLNLQLQQQAKKKSICQQSNILG